ncbi:MAG: HDIG domain-containing protein, partial [Planctomycetes bacterium]|nr:HDIG domain-containing protein [Planctomycetota bacterium]
MKKIRHAMADKERLKTLAAKEGFSNRRKLRLHNRIYYTCALFWAILASLPSLYLGKPIPYTIGTTASHDIHSRVDFRWHDAIAEAQAIWNLESTYARRYREEPFLQWAAETHLAIEQFINLAVTSDYIGEVEQAANELSIPASLDQIHSLWRGAQVAKNDPFHYLVSPLKEILDNEIYPQGILDSERFEIEHGRTIQIIRGDSQYSAMVGGERGPSTPSQLSEALERRFRLRFSVWIPDDFKAALREVVLKRLKPTLVYDEAVSKAGLDERREELLSRIQSINRNDLLVPRGALVTLDKFSMLREEERVFRETQGRYLPLTRVIGNFLLFAAISLSMVIYFRAAEDGHYGMIQRFLAMSALCLIPICSGYFFIYMGIPSTILPIGLAVGIAALGMSSRAAVFIAAAASLCGLILFEARPDLMVGNLLAGLFFIHTAPNCRWRIGFIIMSALSGFIGALFYTAWNFARGDPLYVIFASISTWPQAMGSGLGPLLAALGMTINWAACGIIILLFLSPIERFFGVTTRIHLQDLAAQEHPLLNRLIIEAPGTYHHSSIVSTLAEIGAASIGADGLTARIGGLFHDIGKLLKPEYFTENEFGISRHEKMNPSMSALLIINHVRDGVEMARIFGLPKTVVDMILQHHGDSLMKFFHNAAVQQEPTGTLVAR